MSKHDTTPSQQGNGEDDPADDVQYPPDTLPDLTTRVGRIDSELDLAIEMLRRIRVEQDLQAQSLRRLESAINSLARGVASVTDILRDHVEGVER